MLTVCILTLSLLSFRSVDTEITLQRRRVVAMWVIRRWPLDFSFRFFFFSFFFLFFSSVFRFTVAIRRAWNGCNVGRWFIRDRITANRISDCVQCHFECAVSSNVYRWACFFFFFFFFTYNHGFVIKSVASFLFFSFFKYWLGLADVSFYFIIHRATRWKLREIEWE